MRFPETSNTWMFAMFKNFIHSQDLEQIEKPTTDSGNLYGP